MIRLAAALLAALAGSASAREPTGLHEALDRLTRDGRFSGAVVVRDSRGVRFARGYGLADPFAGRPFTPETPVDSGSLAKPLTAAAVLALAADGKIDLDAPAARYLPELGDPAITVRFLMSHSAGLPFDDSEESLAGKSNLQLVKLARGKPLLFRPGTAFAYCNLCPVALAVIVEREAGQSYLAFARQRLDLPATVTLRPARLADWAGRAIGYGRDSGGKLELADSFEGEMFYGPANLSISAAELAEWGTHWWSSALRPAATATATIGGKPSGLSLGNWYCAPSRTRCHYLGHHQGFHHMLYWNAPKRLSVAMVSNNSLDPTLQQRLQRALVAFAEERRDEALAELTAAPPETAAAPGRYRLASGEVVEVRAPGSATLVRRGGIDYPAYRVSPMVRYVPGLDLYIGHGPDGALQWLTLYEDQLGSR